MYLICLENSCLSNKRYVVLLFLFLKRRYFVLKNIEVMLTTNFDLKSKLIEEVQP